MKKIIILSIFLTTMCAISQWENVGNCDRVTSSQKQIKSFAITTDSKYIFTMGTDSTIKKIDYETGITLWSKTINPTKIPDYHQAFVNLSSDAKTYCISYVIFPIPGRFVITFKNFVYDIESQNLIDSIITIDSNFFFCKLGGASEYSSAVYLCDFDSQINRLFYSTTIYTKINGKYDCRDESGYTAFYQKINNVWEQFFLCNQYQPYVLKFNKQKDLFSGYFHVFNQTTINTMYDYYAYKNLVYNFNNNTPDIFYLFQGGNKWYPKVEYIHYEYSLFSLDNNNLIIFKVLPSYYNTQFYISKYNLKSKKFVLTKQFQDYNGSQKDFSQPLDSNYFIFLRNNVLYVHNINTLNFCNSFKPDSLTAIAASRNYHDSKYFFVADTKDKIYRIKLEDILKLKSNFMTTDTIYMTGDTVKFEECTVGYPEKYSWDFGDGSSISELPNPIHVYSDSGRYDVKLIVTKGNIRDTAIKNRYVHVVPKIVADFDYEITGLNLDSVSFKNESLGTIDSVLWSFGDSTISKEYNPKHRYIFDGDYVVTLRIYYNKFKSSLTKIIKLKIVLSKLDSTKYSYEFLDPIHPFAFALKGWEDNDNYLVYNLIKQDTTSTTIGAFHNYGLYWEYVYKNNVVIEKRNNGSYAFVDTNSISNIDKNGTISNKNYQLNSKEIITLKNFNNFITGSYISSKYYAQIFDADNVMINKYEFKNYDTATKKKYKYFDDHYATYYYSNKIDYAITTRFHHETGYDNNDYLYYNMNNVEYLYGNEMYDFVRLNDSLIIDVMDNRICILKSFGLNLDNISAKNYLKLLKDSFFVAASFNTVIRINDTSFAVCGSYYKHPLYIFLNDKFQILKYETFTDRYGEFLHISMTPDSNLLFSGFRYSSFEVRSPYFVKTNDNKLKRMFTDYVSTISSVDEKNKENHETLKLLSDYIISPNPATDFIEISDINPMLKHGVEYSDIRIYNVLGEIQTTPNLTPALPASGEGVRIDVSGLAPGVYFVRMGDKVGKFIKL